MSGTDVWHVYDEADIDELILTMLPKMDLFRDSNGKPIIAIEKSLWLKTRWWIMEQNDKTKNSVT
jgi:hypothetical protein